MVRVKGINFFKAFIMMLPKFAKVSPALLAAFGIVCCLHGIARAFLVPATQFFLERAMDFSVSKTDFKGVAAGLALLAAAHVCRQLVHGVHHMILITYWRRAEGAFSLELHDKLGRLSPVDFEDTGKLDDINKAVLGKDEAVWFTGSVFTVFAFYVPYFVFMAAYLVNVKPVLVFLLAIVFAPTFLAHIFRTRVFSRAEDEAAPVRRQFDYYEQCLTGREYFKETRILGAFSFFRKQYADALSILNGLVFKASVKSGAAETFMKLLSLCGYIGILLILFDLLMGGEISVGAFAAIFASMEMVFSLMRELIYDVIGTSAQNLSRVQNYLRLLQMPERDGSDTAPPYCAGIELRNVSFSYPGAGQKAVDGVTLSVKNGETIALVGENGSGKTTLIRLLTGLYLPDEGEVLYGAVNTKTVSAPALYDNISAVFQKYRRYQMTLRENVCLSDTEAEAGGERLDNACAQAGVDSYGEKFENGYDTMLSREFDGVDLSGGEWQRVAIARGLFRARGSMPETCIGRWLIALDEPTAAIDPIEETRIYGRFAEISREKTAVIVTHRLGSVRFADRVLVMKCGRLAEQGTHEGLLAKDGEYARLYRAQEKWYQ